MNYLISYLSRKSRGGVTHKDETVASDILRFGRGADCEVHLTDPRVLLNHAQIQARPGGFYLEASPRASLRVNGGATQAASLRLGDKIALGPYDLEVVEAPAGHDLALTVELTRPLGDALEHLVSVSQTGLTRIGLSKRGWSWLAFAAVLVLFLLLPVYAHFSKPAFHKADMVSATRGWFATADISWNPGEISSAHKFFGENCGACHQKAFTKVQDEACLNCHATVHNHADVKKFQVAAFSGQLCESCHREHKGNAAIVLTAQAFCTNCHGDLKAKAPGSALPNIDDFGSNHPEFRPEIMQPDGKLIRVALNASPRPQEGSNLIFPHAKHLTEKGVRSPDKGLVKLQCSSCHRPDAGGIRMQPIRFETDCQSCHSLRFEPSALDRELPHGKPSEAQKVLQDFYAGVALRGGVQQSDAPEVVRRRPGEPLVDETERKAALAWAEQKAGEATLRVFSKSLCGSCHQISKQGENWEVAKVRLNDHWLLRAKFTHGQHTTVGCANCHADAAKSESSGDILLPGIATCRNCHGGEHATDKVPSSCVSCHDFHRERFGVLRAAEAVPMKQN